jgi:hypothetical protein
MSTLSADLRPAVGSNSIGFGTVRLSISTLSSCFCPIDSLDFQITDFIVFLYISLLLRVLVCILSILVVITILSYCPLLSSRGHA